MRDLEQASQKTQLDSHQGEWEEIMKPAGKKWMRLSLTDLSFNLK